MPDNIYSTAYNSGDPNLVLCVSGPGPFLTFFADPCIRISRLKCQNGKVTANTFFWLL